MATDLPQFTAELRQQRQSQTFNDWSLREANRELRDTPAWPQMKITQRAAGRGRVLTREPQPAVNKLSRSLSALTIPS